MKTEFTFAERAYLANLARRRAIETADNAAATIDSRQRVEFAEESRFAENLALRLDAGEDLVVERKDPIIAHPRLDIDAVDARRTA